MASIIDEKIQTRSPVRHRPVGAKQPNYIFRSLIQEKKHLHAPIFASPSKTVVMSQNASRRAVSARKIRQIRERLAVVRTAMKPKSFASRIASMGSSTFDTKRTFGVSLKVPTGAPETPKGGPVSCKKRGTATPLSCMLQGAFQRAEKEFPADLNEKNLLETFSPTEKNEACKSLENLNSIDDDATRNLNDMFGACDSPIGKENVPEQANMEPTIKTAEGTKDKEFKKATMAPPKRTPMKSRLMSKLDLVVTSVHTAGQQYGTVKGRVRNTPVRRSARLRRLARDARK